jgi:hypothetical protein
LPKSSNRLIRERSHSRKKTWAVETFVRCKNNLQQAMISLSIDMKNGRRRSREVRRPIFGRREKG